MNFNKLKTTIENNNNIPINSYSLNGGLPNEALCIAHMKDKWELYYSERGRKTNLKIYRLESEACEYFYNYLLKMLGLKLEY